ncbi:hypothetical protein E1264_06640 [Actinomadura sp. KC216]|uniref:DnaB-like helicase N-terminal domain-containing protein n=1 Tax=Actinomadura sp. KC216 TaxID=2530370 RepID=UPI00105357A1|nr:DnaB-like helicase N-terminal domain-containing protein [Actinomadura sp. KC216]TDB89987.1 hypothetical protein E1264_06640 [Actinomadura sp. KC216]
MANLTVVADPDDNADFSRTLPHDIGAEQQVLGAMMLSPRAATEARELLDGTEFYRPAPSMATAHYRRRIQRRLHAGPGPAHGQGVGAAAGRGRQERCGGQG